MTYRAFVFVLLAACAALAQQALTPDKRMVRAVQYPYDQKVKLTLFSTGRLEGIGGSAEVKRLKSGIEVEVELEEAPPPSALDPGYRAYVIWALTPAGKFVHLGALEGKGKLKVTTSEPRFAIVVSAEADLKAAAMTDAVLETGYPLGKRRLYPMQQVQYNPRPQKK